MSQVNDLKFSALTALGYTSGSLNDREYQWLSTLNSRTGITLNDQWMVYLASLGYTTGTINERQMQAWIDRGYGNENLLLETGDDLLLEDGGQLLLQTSATTWPHMATNFWTAGGVF